MNPHYQAVASRALHRCKYCHAPETVFNFPFEVEHVNPSSRGGTSEFENQALACRSCNAFKSDLVAGLDPATGLTAPLFHPREQAWDEHFDVELALGEIRGKTDTGRVTVLLLQLNSPRQVQSRRHWIAARLFP